MIRKMNKNLYGKKFFRSKQKETVLPTANRIIGEPTEQLLAFHLTCGES